MKSMAFRIASRRFFSIFPHPSSSMASKAPCEVDERSVLRELSDLLPFERRGEPIPKSTSEPGVSEERTGVRPVDEFLSPEEKLRGVFLQKPRGTSAIERALTEVGVDLSVDIVAKVVNRGNLDGEKMVRFFNWAIKEPAIPKDIETYHIVLKALSRRKFLSSMLEILHNMRSQGVSPNLETVSLLADGLLKARRVSRAIQMFRNLKEIGLSCDTESLNVFLQCLCRRSHAGAANSMLYSMKSKIAFDCGTYNAVMSGWSKFGRVSEMERLLEMMIADGVDPDSSTFCHLIEGLGKASRVEESVKIFESMKEKGLAPDTNAYNAVMSNFMSVGKFDECMKYYNRMLVSSDCEPNMETYTKLIRGFLKARKVADGLEMLDEMLKRGLVLSTGTVTSFIEVLCSYGPPHAAMMVYKKAKGAGCRVSESAYKLLLHRLSRFGKCGTLFSVWNEMQECGFSSDVEVYECVIEGLCNNGQVENAVLVMEECLRRGFCPGRLVCSKLNRKLIGSEKVERAYRLFLKIKEARKGDNARKYWRSKGWHF